MDTAVVKKKKTKMVKDRKMTKEIKWLKMCWVLVCKNCRLPCCVYLRYTVLNAKGPTKTLWMSKRRSCLFFEKFLFAMTQLRVNNILLESH